MIAENKRLWFKKAVIFLEDNLPDFFELKKKYDSITIISHKKLDLPECKLREKDTSLIDLTLPEDEIFRRFSDTTRNEIRRTLKEDPYSFFIGQNSDELYSLYKSFEKAQGRVPVTKREMDIFKSAYIAYNGEILYGLYIIESLPYMRIRSIFSKRLTEMDKEKMKRISNAGRRLFWEVCLYGEKRNFISLDLASVNKNNPKTVKIAEFKLSFGGNIIREYTYEYRSPFFALLEKIYSFLNACLRTK